MRTREREIISQYAEQRALRCRVTLADRTIDVHRRDVGGHAFQSRNEARSTALGKAPPTLSPALLKAPGAAPILTRSDFFRNLPGRSLRFFQQEPRLFQGCLLATFDRCDRLIRPINLHPWSY